jgi:hypothetical protein
MIDGQLMNDVLTVLLVAAVFYGCAVLSYSFGSTDSEKMENRQVAQIAGRS